MEFLFHSVYQDGRHARYYNIYRVENDRYFAECHHFNRERNCSADFELSKLEGKWSSNAGNFDKVASYIGEEIDRAAS